MELSVVILAAGQGTRMRSKLPKVLHTLADKSMLEHVINCAESLNPAAVHVVIGHGADQVKETLAHKSVNWVEQTEQLGTGHAVAQALPHIDINHHVLVLYGDVPLTSNETLATLVSNCEQGLALLTVTLDDPTGYGRIVRNSDNEVQRIVEHKDATPEEHEIREVNTGVLAASKDHLSKWIAELSNDNAQGEYYLTDIIAMAVKDHVTILPSQPDYEYEVSGVNNKSQLAALERIYQRNIADSLFEKGVMLRDPNRIDVRGELTVARDVTIDINCLFEGKVDLADDVNIGPNCVIKNASLGEGAVVHANTVIEDAVIGAGATLGPFARIRPGTKLGTNSKIGNFVEVKKANIGNDSKVNHLSYVGDSEVGERVNIGAGTITCNYDGANKYVTTIGDDVFVGSDTQLVAPVTIAAGATIGAGSTITKDCPENTLSLSRSKQVAIDGWTRPTKNK